MLKQEQVINLNNIIPPWDYIKIMKELVRGGLFSVGEIKNFKGELAFPLDYPYQCDHCFIRDFDRRHPIFFLKERLVGAPYLGWDLKEQTVLTTSMCEWVLVEISAEFQLFLRDGARLPVAMIKFFHCKKGEGK